MKQKEGAIRQLEDNLYEMSKSLTRTVDDVDRDAMLKNQVIMVAMPQNQANIVAIYVHCTIMIIVNGLVKELVLKLSCKQ